MNDKDDLKSLSDDELLRCLSDVLAQSRRLEWVVVAHIAEVDARRLYAREGSPSMFQFCLDVLHLSESEAYRRIAAATTKTFWIEPLTRLSVSSKSSWPSWRRRLMFLQRFESGRNGKLTPSH